MFYSSGHTHVHWLVHGLLSKLTCLWCLYIVGAHEICRPPAHIANFFHNQRYFIVLASQYLDYISTSIQYHIVTCGNVLVVCIKLYYQLPAKQCCIARDIKCVFIAIVKWYSKIIMWWNDFYQWILLHDSKKFKVSGISTESLLTLFLYLIIRQNKLWYIQPSYHKTLLMPVANSHTVRNQASTSSRLP